MKQLLTEQDYINASKILGVEVAVIKAVSEVESNGSGFQVSGFPKILYEGHIFYRLTKGKFGINDLSYKSWTKKYYGLDQNIRLSNARKLDNSIALQSTSWGAFQIMGFHYRKCGFNTVQDFVNAMCESNKSQLFAFCNFIKNSGLQDELKNKQWASFALQYNGIGYKANNYDVKLEKAYKKHLND